MSLNKRFNTMSSGDSSSSTASSSSKTLPKFVDRYSSWRPRAMAFMLKVGIPTKAYFESIPRWNDFENAVNQWDADDFNDAVSIEVDGVKNTNNVSSTTITNTNTNPANAGPGTSQTKTTRDEAIVARRRVIRELVKSSYEAYGYLYEALTDDLRAVVKAVPTGYAYGIWKFLEDKYQNTEQDNVAELYKKWNDLTIHEDESFDSYKARVDEIHTLLDRAKDKPSPGMYQYTVLDKAAVLPKFRPAVLALRAGDRFNVKDPAKTNWVDVVSFINAHERNEDRLNDAQAERDETQLAANAMARPKPWNKLKGAMTDGKWARTKTSSDVECHYCHEKGHIKPQCPKLNKQQQQSNINGNKGGTQNKPKCGKCGAHNHSTSEHDDSKVPLWRRNRQAARANAASTNDHDGYIFYEKK